MSTPPGHGPGPGRPGDTAGGDMRSEPRPVRRRTDRASHVAARASGTTTFGTRCETSCGTTAGPGLGWRPGPAVATSERRCVRVTDRRRTTTASGPNPLRRTLSGSSA